ncbi:MAG: DNA/RNA nuclease SfsA [Candidatus Adiutrix sp.]|jgi:sugar fermentation stimulation protein A|nr:DNA/RNA nuclease SfsA [Candidatus Adiutrix sp.]
MKGKDYLAETPAGSLSWGPLTPGILLRRHKRFLAEVELADGRLITAHTANTGRMTGCAEPGRPVWLSHHPSASRRLPYTWEMILMPTALVGINPQPPNRLAALAARAGLLAEMDGPARVETEVKCGASRLDLRLTDRLGRTVLVEAKNSTLAEDGTAYFPDAVTARGARHLDELAARARAGERTALLVIVQRGDAERFSPADHIDPEWGRRLRAALDQGMEAWIYRAELTLETIGLGSRLPLML